MRRQEEEKKSDHTMDSVLSPEPDSLTKSRGIPDNYGALENFFLVSIFKNIYIYLCCVCMLESVFSFHHV